MRCFRMLILTLVLSAPSLDAQVLSYEKYIQYFDELDLEFEALGVVKRVDREMESKTFSVSLLTETLPVTFGRLEKNADGDWEVGANVSLGISYVYMTGKGTIRSDKSIEVEPQFFIGLTSSIGLTQTAGESKDATESLMFGGVVGFGGFGFMAGYDFLTESSVLGISTQLDFTTITEKLTAIISIGTPKSVNYTTNIGE